MLQAGATQAPLTSSGADSETAETQPKNELLLTNPVVKNGLEMRVTERKIVIGAGQCLVNGKTIDLPEPCKVQVPPAGFLNVTDDPVKFEFKGKLTTAAILPHCRAAVQDTTILRGILVPDSVKLKSAPGADGAPYHVDSDYAVDPKFGTITRPSGSRIKTDQKLFADYQCWRRRIDTIALDPAEARFVLIQGIPARSAPEPPVVPPALVPLANVYTNWGDGDIPVQDVMPIAGVPKQDPAVAEHNWKATASLVKKMNTGEPVKVAFWGDSVTVGFDARTRDDSYVNSFVRRLKKQYPKANLLVSNLGISGSNSSQRLPGLETEVFGLKPDLIVVEYVNDLPLASHVLTKDYEYLLDEAKKINACVILCTPHWPVPRMARTIDWTSIAEKPYFEILRELAAHNDFVAIADVSWRWQNLDKEGLRPDLLLVDQLVHPNNKGHSIYADELMRCFAPISKS